MPVWACLAAPVLMLADYYLTLLGARLAQGAYRERFRLEHYELNPIWRTDVARHRLFNLRHLALTALVTGAYAAIFTIGHAPDWYEQFLFGLFLGPFGHVIGRHLSNIVLFRHLARHADDVAGAVTMSLRYALTASIGQLIGVAFPIALLALATRAPLALGASAGLVVLLVAHFFWLARARAKYAA